MLPATAPSMMRERWLNEHSAFIKTAANVIIPVSPFSVG